MNCKRCGRPIGPGERWCSFCGEAAPPMLASEPDPLTSTQPYSSGYVQYGTPPTSGNAIAAFVLAILGLVGPLVLIGPLLSLVLVGRTRRQIRGSAGAVGGWELARAARILSWTALVLLLIGAGVVAGLIAYANYSGRTLFQFNGFPTPTPIHL